MDASRGKGSHATLYLGESFTIVKDRKKEIGPGLLASMLADLILRWNSKYKINLNDRNHNMTIRQCQIRIPINKKSLGRIPTGMRPPQTIQPKKGKGSYRRKRKDGWDETT